MPSAPSPTLSSGRPQRKSTATGVLAAGRKTGVAPQTTILKPEATGNNGSRRNPARQSHVITPGANGTMRRDASDDRSKERRGLVNRSNGLVNKEVKSKSPRPTKGTLLPAPRLNEGRKSPRRMSPESASKPIQEESLMPPPRPVNRRRSPRPPSPEPVSKSRPAPSTETRRLDAGQAKARSTARSPVAETVSKPSTSAAAASTKRRSGVVKEVEKMQVIEFKPRWNFVLILLIMAPN